METANNYPLKIILELAEKLNSLEKKLNNVYISLNKLMEIQIKNMENFKLLKEDVIEMIAELSKEIDEIRM
jgi:hypothetical protein